MKLFRRPRVAFFVVGVGSLIVMLFVMWLNTPLGYLQMRGKSVQSYTSSRSFNGDYKMCIMVHGDEILYHNFARHLGLIPIENGILPFGCDGWQTYDVSWWDPPASLKGAYYMSDKRRRILLSYCNGKIYFDACKW